MKIEKISDTKIKIVLSENEITSWNNIANTRIPDYNAMLVDLKSKPSKAKEVSSCRVVAEFEDIESILMFDTHFPVYATMLRGSNSLYSHNGYYYLDITLPSNFSGYADSLRGNLSEFSTLTGGTVIPYLLPEHGKCLIEKNALLLLRKMN